jgi:hypothetical protein
MVWWRRVLLWQSWTNNVGLGSLLAGPFGRSLYLADLLGRDLVIHPPRRLSLRGVGRSPHLTDLLDEGLFSKWAIERFMGLALGTPSLGTR